MSQKISSSGRKRTKRDTIVNSKDPVKCDFFEIEHVEIKEEEIDHFCDENEIGRLADFKTENSYDELDIKEEEIIIDDKGGMLLRKYRKKICKEFPAVQKSSSLSSEPVSRPKRNKRKKPSERIQAKR